MILSAQAFVFIQEYGEDYENANQIASILENAGFKNFDLMLTLWKLVSLEDTEIEKYIKKWSEALHNKGISVRTTYVDAAFHEAYIELNKDKITKIFDIMKSYFSELQIIITNPYALENEAEKTNEMLLNQARDLEVLSDILSKFDISLSYHFHTAELKNNAKELHFMMQTLSPEKLKLTFDVNWCLRGKQPIMNLLIRYLNRINVVHLRSSKDGVWLETLSNNDDERTAETISFLRKENYSGIYVIELANENSMIKSMDLESRLRESKKIFESMVSI